MSRTRSAAASLALAAALVAVALWAEGGTALGRTTTVELLLLAVGAVFVCAALLYARRGPVYGAATVYCFATLTAIVALSISWSIAPDSSYVETGRTLAYLWVFAGAVAAAHLFPRSAAQTARGVALAAVGIAGLGLAARVWPGAVDETALGGRIGFPYDYWNALAGTAAIGLIPVLWLAVRRDGGRLERSLAIPALGVLVATVLITQSRGALAACAIAVLLWLAIVPLRLRSLAALAVAAVGVAPVTAWALSQDAFVEYGLPSEAREAVASDFGLLLLATLCGLLAAGWALVAIERRVPLSVGMRSRIGLVATIAALAVPLAVVASVTAGERGLGGTISDRFDELTNEQAAVPPVGGGRLGSVSSSRTAYWRQAWSAFEERPAVGLGAGSFELSRLAHRKSGLNATRAHGFVPETLTSLGLVGLVATLALLAAWLAAAARATDLAPRRGPRRADWSTERTALVALTLAATAYGLQGLLDWTWFVPGVTVMALVAAGFVAGCGPPPRIGADGERDAPERTRPTGAAIAAAAMVAVAAILCGWTVWQPAGADKAVTRSYELFEKGRLAAAETEAEQARERNPYSIQPLYVEARILAAQARDSEALEALQTAIDEHPRDPEPWLQAASFTLDELGLPAAALRLAETALRLDPYSKEAVILRDSAAAAVEQRQRERRREIRARRLTARAQAL